MLIFPSIATAFATADFSTLPITLATCFGVKSRISVTWSTRFPRISCRTWSTLRGVTRTYLAFAVASIVDQTPIYLGGGAAAGAVVFSTWDPCPRKMRVGENSPSLCPTMFSVM